MGIMINDFRLEDSMAYLTNEAMFILWDTLKGTYMAEIPITREWILEKEDEYVHQPQVTIIPDKVKDLIPKVKEQIKELGDYIIRTAEGKQINFLKQKFLNGAVPQHISTYKNISLRLIIDHRICELADVFIFDVMYFISDRDIDDNKSWVQP